MPVPDGFRHDPHGPDQFVVTCTDCGRVGVYAGRSTAHNVADGHARSCAPTGVTPVSKVDDDETSDTATEPPSEPADDAVATDGGRPVTGDPPTDTDGVPLPTRVDGCATCDGLVLRVRTNLTRSGRLVGHYRCQACRHGGHVVYEPLSDGPDQQRQGPVFEQRATTREGPAPKDATLEVEP